MIVGKSEEICTLARCPCISLGVWKLAVATASTMHVHIALGNLGAWKLRWPPQPSQYIYLYRDHIECTWRDHLCSSSRTPLVLASPPMMNDSAERAYQRRLAAAERDGTEYECTLVPYGWDARSNKYPDYIKWNGPLQSSYQWGVQGDVLLPDSCTHKLFHYVTSSSVDGEDPSHAQTYWLCGGVMKLAVATALHFMAQYLQHSMHACTCAARIQRTYASTRGDRI